MESYFVNHKKISFLIILCAIVSFSLTGCWYPYLARNARTTPIDFPESEWQSEEPFIFLRVNKNLQMDGYMILDSRKIEIECAIEWGETFLIYKKVQHSVVEVSDYVLEGDCVCTEQQIILKVKKDYCFENQYDVIILNRIDSEKGTNG
ncbi:MAG: hypothetical protein IJK63_06640 [Oscillospiraceae bacterium]|nr:hypothetical protein [Oscillospiraceae bacterium]